MVLWQSICPSLHTLLAALPQHFYIQDESSMLVAPVLAPQPRNARAGYVQRSWRQGNARGTAYAG